MNYRRGFQRLYAVLAVAWVALLLFTLPSDRLKFWQQTPTVPTFEEFKKSLKLPPGAVLAPEDYNSSFISNSEWQAWKPGDRDQPTSRTQKGLSLAGVLFIPPALAYVAVFFVIPWIYRGFRPTPQI